MLRRLCRELGERASVLVPCSHRESADSQGRNVNIIIHILL